MRAERAFSVAHQFLWRTNNKNANNAALSVWVFIVVLIFFATKAATEKSPFGRTCFFQSDCHGLADVPDSPMKKHFVDTPTMVARGNR
ncbi:MAG TPA: hypothetical protein VIF60_11730 [Burkholderiaceae bacterium]